MIRAADFVLPALARGYGLWTGVPCSYLDPFIRHVIAAPDIDYVGAASEGEAVAISLGAHLGGRKAVVMAQNSGLGNMVNPLASLCHPFRAPALLIISHRGAPGEPDEPQHELMGRVTGPLLETLGIPWRPFPRGADQIAPLLEEADAEMGRSGLPFALVMRQGSVEDAPVEGPAASPALPGAAAAGRFSVPGEARITRTQALETLLSRLSGRELLIATTGKTGRELFALGHRPAQLYVVGGMGCASGIGLGLSLVLPGRRVIVIDGDGSVLMKMGTLATIGNRRPANLCHIVLDNEAHDSTGGQATASSTADFAAIAAACGYRLALRADTAPSLADALGRALTVEGPALVHMKIRPGSPESLPRPALTPVQVKEMFMAECARP